MSNLFNITALIQTVGYVGIWAIIFAESGLLIGFIFPGDSLLFTAGFLASQNLLDIWALTIICFTAALLGDNVGYSFGKKIGKKIFTSQDSIIFNKENIEKSQRFYEKYGAKAIVLARFVPVIRTLAPIMAGVGEMKYSKFLTYNTVGALIWGVGITWSGFILGNSIPEADNYIILIVTAIIFFSALPQMMIFLKNKERREKLISLIKNRNKRETKSN